MLNNLLESKPQKQRTVGSSIASTILHVGILVFAVNATLDAGKKEKAKVQADEQKIKGKPSQKNNDNSSLNFKLGLVVALLGFGLLYTVWGLIKAKQNRVHKHFDMNDDGSIYVYEHAHGEVVAQKDRQAISVEVSWRRKTVPRQVLQRCGSKHRQIDPEEKESPAEQSALSIVAGGCVAKATRSL